MHFVYVSGGSVGSLVPAVTVQKGLKQELRLPDP